MIVDLHAINGAEKNKKTKSKISKQLAEFIRTHAFAKE